jgi:hypothetical protein
MQRMRYLIAPCLALLQSPVAAQQPATSLSAALGVEQSASRNPGASPYIYRGIGLVGTLRLTRRSEHSEWDVELDGSRGTLRSRASQGGLPREVFTGAALGGGWLRRVRSTGPVEWRAGASANWRLAHLRHDYTGMFATSSDFGFLAVHLAPAASAALPVRGGTLANRVAAPVVTFIDYPYSNAKAHGERVRLRFATLDRLQAIENDLTYRRGPWTWRYRFSFMRYVVGEPRVFANQSLALERDAFRRGAR